MTRCQMGRGMEFRFRQADMCDAANLAALTIQVWLHTYAKAGIRDALSNYVLQAFTAANFKEHLNSPNQMFILCERNSLLIGYLRLDFEAPCPSDPILHVEIVTLYVQEHHIRRGIGSSLLRHAFSACRDRGFAEVWLSVNHENAEAISFYERHKFVRNGSLDFELDGERHENFILRQRTG